MSLLGGSRVIHHILGLRVHFLSLKDPAERIWCCLELREGICEWTSVSPCRSMSFSDLGQGKGRKLYPLTLALEATSQRSIVQVARTRISFINQGMVVMHDFRGRLIYRVSMRVPGYQWCDAHSNASTLGGVGNDLFQPQPSCDSQCEMSDSSLYVFCCFY